ALERRLPSMNERLVTAVELEDFPPAPALIARVQEEAAELTRAASPSTLFSIRSTLRLMMIAVAAGAIVAVLAAANANLAQTWWRGPVLLEALGYPRQPSVVVEGFVAGVRRVGRGRDVEIVVKAWGRAPDRVMVDLVTFSTGQRRYVLPAPAG